MDRVKRNTHIMMMDRDYITEDIYNIYVKPNGKSVLINYFSEKINLDIMKKIITDHVTTYDHIILITSKNITTDAQKITVDQSICYFEIFMSHELMFNLISCVPKHEKVYFKLTNKIAKLLRTDRVVRHYLWPSGSIIRITDNMGVSYRVVL